MNNAIFAGWFAGLAAASLIGMVVATSDKVFFKTR